MSDVHPLRMPISVASHKGVSAVASAAENRRVILTSHGRPVAVVDAPGRIDEDLRTVRDAARAVVEAAAETAATRVKALNLEDVCGRLGLDVEHVRARAAELRTR